MQNLGDTLMVSKLFGQCMADNTFRNIIGYKLLADEDKSNDGIGAFLIMNDSNPFRDVGTFLPKNY